MYVNFCRLHASCWLVQAITLLFAKHILYIAMMALARGRWHYDQSTISPTLAKLAGCRQAPNAQSIAIAGLVSASGHTLMDSSEAQFTSPSIKGWHLSQLAHTVMHDAPTVKFNASCVELAVGNWRTNHYCRSSPYK